MEARRLRAWELLQKGWKQIKVAEALGRRKLKGGQLAQLPELLQQGPGTFGFSGEIWTRARIAQVIRQDFGVSYHPTRVRRLLRESGFSRQQPALRAS